MRFTLCARRSPPYLHTRYGTNPLNARQHRIDPQGAAGITGGPIGVCLRFVVAAKRDDP